MWTAVEGVNVGSADLKKTKGQCHEHLCDTGNSKRNEGRQDKNGTGVQRSLTERLVRSRLYSGQDIERIADDILYTEDSGRVM